MAPKYQCKVSYIACSLLVDKFDFYKNQYLLYYINYFIFVFEYTDGSSFKVIIQGVYGYHNYYIIKNIAIWSNDWLQLLYQKTNISKFVYDWFFKSFKLLVGNVI